MKKRTPNIKFPDKKETVAGVDIFIQEQEIVLNCVVVEIKNNQVSIIDKHGSINGFEELANKIPENIPVEICINGKGLINRTTTEKNDSPVEETINRIMPGVDINQIYYSSCSTDTHFNLCVIRKDIVDEILEQLEVHKLFITGINLGTTTLMAIANLLENEDIISGIYKISPSQGYILKKSDSEHHSTHSIGEEVLEGCYILSYSCALNWKIKPDSATSNLNAVSLEKKSEFLSFKKQRLALIAGLSGAFIILLVNFFYNNHLMKKNEGANLFLNSHNNDLERVEQLKNEVTLKEKYLYSNNLLSGTRFSYYCDKIGMLVPKGIKLNRLNVYPQTSEKSSGGRKKEHFLNKLIVISGKGNNTILQEYIGNLEKESWIEDVDLIDYKRSKEAGFISFTLHIFIK